MGFDRLICEILKFLIERFFDKAIENIATLVGIITSITLIITFVFAIKRFWDYIKGLSFDIAILGHAEGSSFIDYIILTISNHSDRVKVIRIIDIILNSNIKPIWFFRYTQTELSRALDCEEAVYNIVREKNREGLMPTVNLPYVLRLAPKNWADFVFIFPVYTRIGSVINIVYIENGKRKTKSYMHQTPTH